MMAAITILAENALPGRNVMGYSESPVTYLTVPELLQRDSGIVSPAHAPDGLPLLINVDAPPPAPTPLPKFDVGETCLALPVDGSPAVVTIRRRGSNGWPQYSARRRFTEERLALVAESEMEFSLPYRTERLPASDTPGYHAIL